MQAHGFASPHMLAPDPRHYRPDVRRTAFCAPPIFWKSSLKHANLDAASDAALNTHMNSKTNRRTSGSGAKRSPGGGQGGNPANWRQAFERYKALAEEAGRTADAVARENYYQHAEHYLRLIHDAEARA